MVNVPRRFSKRGDEIKSKVGTIILVLDDGGEHARRVIYNVLMIL